MLLQHKSILVRFMPNKICVFDFDGVIGNSRDIIYAIHNDIHKKYGLPKITNRDEFLSVIDNGHLKEQLEEETIRKYHTECNEGYSNRLSNITLFPAIKTLLQRTTQDIIIISSNPDSFIKAILQKEGIEEAIVYGKEVAKTKRERLEMLLKDKGLSKDKIIYIGDTIDDYNFCAREGISMIGSNYGYSNLDDIKDNLISLVESENELVELIKPYMLVR